MQGTDKPALRQELTRARLARPPAVIAAARSAVCAAVLTHGVPAGWRCVGGYVPLRTEPGSTALLDALTSHGVQVLVPLLLADRDLDWAVWNVSVQQPGQPLGVGAIATADAVLVPALAVARDGTRLGRGGGSYDRALRRVPPGVPAAALLYDGELFDALPSDSWDVPVTAVVTPTGWQDLPLA